MEVVEFCPARCRNARARKFRSPEVVARELVIFATTAGITAFTHVGKIPMFVKPGEDRQSVVRRYEREARSMKVWLERRNGTDRRKIDRHDGSERRKVVA